MTPKPGLSCDQVRALMVGRRLGASEPRDDLLMRDHLASCAACRQYELVLVRLESAVASEVGQARPRLEGVEALRAVVRARRSRRSLWASVRELVQVRVPAYQAVLGAAAVAILVFASLPGARRPAAPAWTDSAAGQGNAAMPALTRADSYHVDRMLLRLDRPGRGPGVDTLLIRYLSRQARGAARDRAAM